MDPHTLPLYYFCSFAGLVMVIGGIWLVAKEKIYVDRETKEVTTVELPFGIKMQTNIPALALFLLGFVPLIYPLYATSGWLAEVEISGEVAGSESFSTPLEVLAVVETENLRNPGPFRLMVPDLNGKHQNYKVLYVFGNRVVDYKLPDLAKATKGILPVNLLDFTPADEPSYSSDVDAVTDEFR